MYTLGRSLDYCGVPAIAAETQCLGGRKLSCHFFSILCRAENTWRYFHGGRYLPGGSAVGQVLAVSPRLSIVSTDGGLAVLEAQVHHLALQSFFLSPSSSPPLPPPPPPTHTHTSAVALRVQPCLHSGKPRVRPHSRDHPFYSQWHVCTRTGHWRRRPSSWRKFWLATIDMVPWRLGGAAAASSRANSEFLLT